MSSLLSLFIGDGKNLLNNVQATASTCSLNSAYDSGLFHDFGNS